MHIKGVHQSGCTFILEIHFPLCTLPFQLMVSSSKLLIFNIRAVGSTSFVLSQSLMHRKAMDLVLMLWDHVLKFFMSLSCYISEVWRSKGTWHGLGKKIMTFQKEDWRKKQIGFPAWKKEPFLFILHWALCVVCPD